MPLNFPSSPTNGQVYQNYYYDGSAGAWRSLSSTVNPIPSTLKNLTISSTETTGVSLKVTPFTTSSVNLQEWYNTSSTLVASMNVAGDLTANSLTLTTDLTVANGGTGASSFTSGAYIKGAGSNALTAQVGIPAGDVTSGQLAPAQGGVPTGSIMMWYTDTPPTGWLICNGQSTTGYTALAAIIGATVPNMQQRVPVGKNSGTFATLGATGGVESVTLTAAQSGIPAHSHANTATISITGGAHTHAMAMGSNSGVGSTGDLPMRSNSGSDGNFRTQFEASGSSYGSSTGTHTHSGTITMNNANNVAADATAAHTNLQPYIVINYIIKT